MGNLSLAAGLLAISLGLTYALMPYGNSSMGWENPWVIAMFPLGIMLFIWNEIKVKSPLFNLSLFKMCLFLRHTCTALKCSC